MDKPCRLQFVVEVEGARDDLLEVYESGCYLEHLELVVHDELKAKVSATVMDDNGQILRESDN